MKQPQMYMACFTLVALNQIHAHSGVGPASHDHSGKAVKNVAAGTAAMPLEHKVKSALTSAPKASAMAENSTKIEVKAHVGKKKKQKMANAVAIMQLGVPQRIQRKSKLRHMLGRRRSRKWQMPWQS